MESRSILNTLYTRVLQYLVHYHYSKIEKHKMKTEIYTE